MKVSVVIPTYNEESVIVDCLKSLSKQTLKNIETIVIDDGSTDKTLSILRNSQNQNYKLQLLQQDHKGPGAARNLGAKEAKGEILVFVDADMTFDKDFLKKLIEPIEKGNVKGTFSKEEYVANWENVWARCWNINEGWMEKRRHPANYPDRQKVFRAVLKSEFDRVGGFTPGGYNDDWSLSEKLGYLAENAPSAVFFHKNPQSLQEIFRHALWVGKRSYKLGLIGTIYALLRSCMPVSLLLGSIKSLRTGNSAFLPFKLVYDAGTFIGIIKYSLTKEGGK